MYFKKNIKILNLKNITVHAQFRSEGMTDRLVCMEWVLWNPQWLPHVVRKWERTAADRCGHQCIWSGFHHYSGLGLKHVLLNHLSSAALLWDPVHYRAKRERMKGRQKLVGACPHPPTLCPGLVASIRGCPLVLVSFLPALVTTTSTVQSELKSQYLWCFPVYAV